MTVRTQLVLAALRPGGVAPIIACTCHVLLLLSCIGNLLQQPALFAQTRTSQSPQLGEAGQAAVWRRAMGSIIADRHVPDSAFDIHRRAMTMSAALRYEHLSDWVLPGSAHDTLRVTLDFTSTHPAPPSSEQDAIDAMRIDLAKQVGQRRVQTGGNIISPALDLNAAAKELGKLDTIRTQIDIFTPRDESQQRARLALLALINIELQDMEAALRNLDALFQLVESNDGATLLARSPELLAIHAAIAHPGTRDFARDAAATLFVRCVRVPSRGPAVAWESHLMAMMALIRNLDRQTDESSDAVHLRAAMSLAPRLGEWNPTSRTTAASRGAGHSRAHWQIAGERIANANSHQDDFLYYHVPLQGDLQVQCDLQVRDFQNTQLVVGGHWAEPLFYSRDKYEYGDRRRRVARSEIEPPLTKFRDWVHLRATVQEGVVSYYANGRLIHRVELPGDVDPWIALRSESRYDGGAVDVRITGGPEIPAELRLTASDELAGWFPYFDSSLGSENAAWQQLGDSQNGGGISGQRRLDLAGMHAERLLHYHRPMFEDGTIEYEFYYDAGEVHVHPALDRLAFLLEPGGVRIHWVTDGRHDRTGLDPDNAFDEPAQRRGPDNLPLKQNDWNRLRLTLDDDSVSLHLNQQLVYERELEITNQRSFGLFHYADRSEARVRNVRWRGEWPRALPRAAKQELASDAVPLLDERLAKLPSVVEHDFAAAGLPAEKFTLVTGSAETVEHVSNGLHIDRPGGQGYHSTSIAPNVIVAGDFDVVAEFQRFDPRPAADAISTIGIRISTSDVNAQQCLVMRRLVRDPRDEDRHLVQAVVRNGTTDADLDWNTLYSDADESESGRLRIARRGNRVYYLMAEGDSPHFRLLGEAEAITGTLPRHGIQLLALSSGEGRMSVLWNNIAIRAESLVYLPPSDAALQRTLSVMNHDGTGVRQVLPKDTEIDGPGSPAWSPDGRQIAFDVYNGSTASSRIYLINADGSELRDLGIGNMPTFSPDGKRIAFSWGDRGVAVMNVDGTNREVLDSGGWGAQWSPDGESIAYGKRGNVVVHDLRTDTPREILEGEQASRYSYIYWNLGWSRDSQRVCFKARTRGENQYEVAVAAVAGSRQEFQVLYTSDREMNADFSWYPDGNRILFSMRVGGALRLFFLDRRKPETPALFPGQPLDHYITGAAWTTDGKYIAFSSQRLPDWDSDHDAVTSP